MRTVLLPVLALLAASCGSREKLEDVFYPMGGIPMRITAFDVTQSRFDTLFEEVRGRVEDLEGELSMFIPDSDIAMLNTKGAGEVSEDTVAVVEQALRLCKNTGGAFDPTVGPLMELWHNAAATDRAPEPKDLAAALERVGCNKVETSRSRSRVHLGQAGMRLDLGGIAKGYAAGEAAAIMQAHGVTRGIVDLGGDVVLFSGKGDPPFRVGIKHPLAPEKIFAVLTVVEGSVVTSGCYERFVEVQGQRVCHIVDPRTGRPAAGLLSVTVLSRDAAAADAYATALFVLGPEEGFAMAKTLPDVEAVFLMEDGDGPLRMKATPGLTGRIELAE